MTRFIAAIRRGFAPAALTFTCAPQILEAQTITMIDVLPGHTRSEAAAVSANGAVVVGRSSVGFSGDSSAVRWTAQDGTVALPLLQGQTQSWAAGISDDGIVIVGSVRGADGNSHSSRWVGSQAAANLGLMPDELSSEATAVNRDGSAIAGSMTHTAQIPRHAFRWTSAAGPQDLGPLQTDRYASVADMSADGSVIVGNSTMVIPIVRPYFWTEDTGFVVLPYSGWADATATAVTADGSVIFGEVVGPNLHPRHAVRWPTRTTFEYLAKPAGFMSSNVTCTNPDGSIAGGALLPTSIPQRQAALWTPQTGFQSLNTLLPALGIDLSGWVLDIITDISDDGRVIVGNGRFNDENRGWVVTLPSPCTADFNDSGAVDATDVFVYLNAWFEQNGQTGPNLSADFNDSGNVDATDIFVFLDAWFEQNGTCG